MSDPDAIANDLSHYVGRVIDKLSVSVGSEAASLRVLEHLRAVLRAGMTGTPAEEMALLLTKLDAS